MEIAININNKTILLDTEDFDSLPTGHYFKFDKDGYPLVYWYSRESRREENIRLSRWIMYNPKGFIVDHINRNILDNRKQNLRKVTSSQNSMNVGPKHWKNFKGTSFNKQNKWQAMIKVNRKSIYLGQFLTEEDAAKAYDTAAKEYFGEYAYLNFPA